MTDTGDVPAGLNAALFLVAAMTCAGIVHVFWMWLAPPAWLSRPIDGGLIWRGRRLFGDNKRVRGLVALPLAAAASFAAFAAWQPALPECMRAGMWPLSPRQYAGLGFASGLACMLAELPNSFIKRRLGVEPGELPLSGALRFVSLAADRLDSPLGMMIAVSSMVSVRPITWLWVLLIGTAVHAGFSALLHLLGLKARAL